MIKGKELAKEKGWNIVVYDMLGEPLLYADIAVVAFFILALIGLVSEFMFVFWICMAFVFAVIISVVFMILYTNLTLDKRLENVPHRFPYVETKEVCEIK